MKGVPLQRWLRDTIDAWNSFWFTPVDPATLSLIRVLAGGMLFYTHLIWSLDLRSFFGPHGWLPSSLLQEAHEGSFAWSYHHWLTHPAALWVAHLIALLVFGLLTLGLWSRVVAVLAYVIAVSYAHRVTPGAFFGLDKINCMLAMYLMLGPCGARYSLDRYLSRDQNGQIAVIVRVCITHATAVKNDGGIQQGPTLFIDDDDFYFNVDTDEEIDALMSTNPVPCTINVYCTENAPFCGVATFTFLEVQGIIESLVECPELVW